MFVALISYSPEDPNFIFPDNTKINNFLGYHGSFTSDLLLQSFGIISYLLPITLIFTGANVFKFKQIFFSIENIFFSILYIILGSLFFNIFFNEAFDLYVNGNGGFVGSYLSKSFLGDIFLTNKNISFYILILLIFRFFYLV